MLAHKGHVPASDSMCAKAHEIMVQSHKKGVVVLANNAFGIDLGTNNIKIYSRSDDRILVDAKQL